jgi:hypothetical protein
MSKAQSDGGRIQGDFQANCPTSATKGYDRASGARKIVRSAYGRKGDAHGGVAIRTTMAAARKEPKKPLITPGV